MTLFSTAAKPRVSQLQNVFYGLTDSCTLMHVINLHLFSPFTKSLCLASSLLHVSSSGGDNLYSHRGVQDLRWIFVSAIYGIKKSILAFH